MDVGDQPIVEASDIGNLSLQIYRKLRIHGAILRILSLVLSPALQTPHILLTSS